MFSIRNAVPDDAALISRLIYELSVYEKMTDECQSTPEAVVEWVFDKKAAEVLIAEEEGIPVGFALFFQNYSTFAAKAGLYLEDLFIRPEYRGKGYGKALLARLAKIACDRGYGRMEWSCLDWNQPSIDFYTKGMQARPMDGWKVYRLSGETLKAAAKKDTSAR